MHMKSLAVVSACIATLVFAAQASASRYIVLLKQGKTASGLQAVAKAGGKVVHVNRAVGIATVVAGKDFAAKLRASGRVDGVARNAAWNQPELRPVSVVIKRSWRQRHRIVFRRPFRRRRRRPAARFSSRIRSPDPILCPSVSGTCG